MGWVKDGSGHWKKIVRKYTYDHYWNWLFSDYPTYTGTTANPDYASHGPEVEPYGSLKDYYREVSNNEFIITPARIRDDEVPDQYNTGIINSYYVKDGKKYISWLMMPKEKYYYYANGKWGPSKGEVLTEIANSSEIDFNTGEFLANGGKILVIVAGSAEVAYALNSNDFMVCREKRKRNGDVNSTLDGPWIIVHEYGHTLDLDHLASSTYDPMNPYFSGSWNKENYSPPHFSPIYKLQKGWLTDTDVIKVPSGSTSNMYIPVISITSSARKVVAVTVYGDAGRSGDWDPELDWTHSEYFLLEYRTRDGFNRFSGGADSENLPQNFQKGGVLIWHRSRYGSYYFWEQNNRIGLKIAGYADESNHSEFIGVSPDPSHFFYPGHSSITPGSDPNTNSILHLYTGISMTSFNNNNNDGIMWVTFKYDNLLPTYSEFYVNNYRASNISGTVFLQNADDNLTVNDGTTVDISPTYRDIVLATDQIVANGSSPNSITFQGTGYGSSRIQWKGMLLRGSSTQQSSIKNCLLSDADLAIKVILDSEEIEPIFNNIQFQNCADDIYLESQGSVYKNLTGYSNLDLTRLTVRGKWQIDDYSTFSIANGSSLKLINPSYIQFGTNSKLYSYGNFEAQGNVRYKITFEKSGSSAWDRIRLYGDHNYFKYCTFDDGEYGVDIRSVDNVFENCVFINSRYAIYARYNAEAYIKNCDFYDNTVGINSYSYCNLQLTGNEIYDNQIGVYTYNNNNILLHGNVIENNLDYGIYTTQYDNIVVGRVQPTVLQKNSIINNGVHGIKAYSYDPEVSAYNSVISQPTGQYDIYNRSGNDPIEAAMCWFGDNGLQYTGGGSVLNYSPLPSAPGWLGTTDDNDGGFLFKAVNNIAGLPDRLMGDEGIISLKHKIEDPDNNIENRLSALQDLYAIQREDFQANHYGERTSFPEYLEKKVKDSGSPRLTEQATLYQINWQILNKDYPRAAEMLNQFITTCSAENRLNAGINLASLYLLNGQRADAQKVLSKLIDTYGTDDQMVQNLQQDINDPDFLPDGKTFEFIATESRETEIPSRFRLSQNFPNPFNPITHIRFELPSDAATIITVYNIKGQKVKELMNEYKQSGSYQVEFDGSDLASGIYFYRINAGEFTQVKKMALIK
jgi:M6 family metalloprotease-like protein